MSAYHGSHELKVAIVAEMRAHAAAETLMRGHYWNDEDKTGCFIGCITKSDSHAKAMERLGCPLPLCHLIDDVFEGVSGASRADGRRFAVDILEAMPVGADLSAVPDHLMAWTMERLLTLEEVTENEAVRSCVDTVRGLYQRRLAGDEPSQEDWDAARAAAWAAAGDAEDAARAAAGDAFWKDFAAQTIKLCEASAS